MVIFDAQIIREMDVDNPIGISAEGARHIVSLADIGVTDIKADTYSLLI